MDDGGEIFAGIVALVLLVFVLSLAHRFVTAVERIAEALQ